ncbi:MAG: hypothetical protein JWO05_154 [Gemmatimonadetes bacterium]|nr:hypothetical protein [Gemmatimonadota bacterium]
MQRRDFVYRTSMAAAGLGVLRVLGGCKLESRRTQADESFLALRDRYVRKHLALNPVTSTYLGGDGLDPALADANGRLRDYSEKALADEHHFYHQTLDAQRGVDPSFLTPASRVDHAVLGAHLAFLMRQVERHSEQRCVDSYVAEPFRGVDWQLQQMEDAGSGMLGSEAEWNLVVSRLLAVPQYLTVARQNLLNGKRDANLPDRRMVQRDGIDGSAANADYFRKALQAQAKTFLGSRPFGAAMQQKLAGAAESAAVAYEGFATFLRTNFDLADLHDHYAAGTEEYEWRVKNILQDTRSAEDLWTYGQRQVDEYTQRIFNTARAISDQHHLGLPFGSDAERNASVRKVMESLGKDAPKNDDELLAWYVEAGKRAVSYGRERGLFEVPTDYRLDVYPTPPVLRATIDAAYYPAPPFKKVGVGRFYLTPTGNSPAALAENNRASVADTAIHEGFPGHDWEYKYMTQHAAEISPLRWLTPGAVEDSSSMWMDSMAMEGWALYSEELMAEPSPERPYGFYTPEEYLYQLQGQLLRAVRVRVDVGLHTGRMTFDDAVDYFTEHVNFFPGARGAAAGNPSAKAVADGATRAIYRYSKWPTQAITYNLGKNAIIALRERWLNAKGGSVREFHERLMRQGSIPTGYFAESFLTTA